MFLTAAVLSQFLDWRLQELRINPQLVKSVLYFLFWCFLAETRGWGLSLGEKRSFWPFSKWPHTLFVCLFYDIRGAALVSIVRLGMLYSNCLILKLHYILTTNFFLLLQCTACAILPGLFHPVQASRLGIGIFYNYPWMALLGLSTSQARLSIGEGIWREIYQPSLWFWIQIKHTYTFRECERVQEVCHLYQNNIQSCIIQTMLESRQEEGSKAGQGALVPDLALA